MTSEFEVMGSTAKVQGEALLPEGTEFEHGDELYVICRVRVREVSFPEKDGIVLRVHKAKADEAFVVDSMDAEKVIAAERERRTGQGNILAEIERRASDVGDHDDEAF